MTAFCLMKLRRDKHYLKRHLSQTIFIIALLTFDFSFFFQEMSAASGIQLFVAKDGCDNTLYNNHTRKGNKKKKKRGR